MDFCELIEKSAEVLFLQAHFHITADRTRVPEDDYTWKSFDERIKIAIDARGPEDVEQAFPLTIGENFTYSK